MPPETEPTANRNQVLNQASVQRSRGLTQTPATEGQAIAGGRPPETDEPPPEGEISELIKENKRVGVVLAKKLEAKSLVAAGKDIAQIKELARSGAAPAKNGKICCLSQELLALLESLATAPELSPAAPLAILSLIRDAKEKKPGKKGFNNHGRLLPESERMIDFSGRVVEALSTGVDIAGFAGHEIRLGWIQDGRNEGRFIGPPLGDGSHVLTAEEGARIKRYKESTLNGILGVLRNVPGGVGRRYSFGFTVPILADNWRDTTPAYTRDHKDLLDDQGYIKEFTCHLFIDPKSERWYPRDKYPASDKYGSGKSPHGLSGYKKQLTAFVDSDARDKFLEAIAEVSEHRPVPIDQQASTAPDVSSRGIATLFPDGVDHLHITAHRPTDPIG